MSLCVALLAALSLDACLGEPRRAHPLVAFGRWAQHVERRCYADSRLRGGMAVALLLLPPTVLAALAERIPVLGPCIGIVLLYAALGWRSLEEHARAVQSALAAGELDNARVRAGYMLSRDTSVLTADGVAAATVESVLENGNDAIFAALFWFALAGAPGVVLFRLANTLDAMWGYRTPHYRRFGCVAARLDDVLNFVPARLTALGYALSGRLCTALHCWRRQAAAWDSPNAGPVMTAGAGSLGLRLGGLACYHGVWEQRPPLGQGRAAVATDIQRALRLIRRTLLLAVLLAGGAHVFF